MGRRKDLKQRQANRAGRARNRQREVATPTGDSGGGPEPTEVALTNDCPRCGAKAGEACKTPSGNIAAKTHAARG